MALHQSSGTGAGKNECGGHEIRWWYMARKLKGAPIAAEDAKSAAVSGPSYWLLKSEPDVFSWEMQKKRGRAGEPWTGVRNYLARNNMRSMRRGDLAFFYHSNIGKEIVGIVRVIAEAHPDPTDDTGKWDCVDVEAVCDLPRSVTLEAVKAEPILAGMSLVTTTRLLVQPVTAKEWAFICNMGGLATSQIERLAGD